MIDENLTAKVQAYIDADPAKRDVEAGALLLLKLNKNRVLYNNIIRAPHRFADKLLYELKKFLQIRLDQKTMADVVQMDKTVVPAVALLIANAAPISTDDEYGATVAKGLRADHNTLPDEIRTLWPECAEIYKKVKLLHENLKRMNDAPPCDRYEHLKQMADLDRSYREKMAAYDDYKPDGENSKDDDKGDPPPGDPSAPLTPADMAKEVTVARSYITKNKKVLPGLDESNPEKHATLLAEMQARYDFLIANAIAITDAQKEELAACGLKV